jgi:hypothetical protein
MVFSSKLSEQMILKNSYLCFLCLNLISPSFRWGVNDEAKIISKTIEGEDEE